MTLYTKFVDSAVVLVTASSPPSSGYSVISNVQAAFNQARSNGVPLFIGPGVYQTTEIIVDSTGGNGGVLHVTSVPGTATLQLTSGNNLLTINGISNCKIENLTLDANNVTFSNLLSSSAVLQIDSCNNLDLSNCAILNSVACGIYAGSVYNANIHGCTIKNCSYGVSGLDSLLVVDRNLITNCANNGVMIFTSYITGNASSVTNNKIFSINSGSGTGQNGNGVVVYQAGSVNVIGNTISGCQYSAIRFNSASDAVIIGNNCYSARENAIFLEAPASGGWLNGGIVSGNVIDTAGGGISVSNSGAGGQGTARSVVVSGNHISGIAKWNIPDPGYFPPNGNGIGISVEQTCCVSGNLVESAAGFGICAGHNGGYDLSINGNLVLSSPVGIGYSDAPGNTGQWLISSNEVHGATSGSIISVSYNDSTGQLSVTSGAVDYGNQYDAQEGNVFVGNNRSY